ncbi:MAG: lactonase family protein [Thomasclavelia sp.]|nr:lactonase family protein [Thomasclavelia sp.]
MIHLYVASYGESDKKGIYLVDYDEKKESFKLVKHIETNDFPSYIIRDEDVLYVALKSSNLNGVKGLRESIKKLKNNDTSLGGGLASYKIEKDDLKELSHFDSNGRSYTHLALSNDKKEIFTANYHVGATASYRLKDHKIDSKIGAIHHTGLGPDPLKRQTGPHAHNVGITPDKKYVYSVDLGADKVVMYTCKDGVLKEDEKHTLNVVPGAGPRHMIFSKDGKYAYIICEISNIVIVYSYKDGFFTIIQIIRCVPRHFHGFSSAAAIKMTDDGNYLFVSNRGHNSIVLYRICKETGRLSLLYMVHTSGEPRDFSIVDDKYLFVGCEDTNVIQTMTFNAKKEELRSIEAIMEVPKPVCICK